jgi:hypothetical protein
MLEDFWMPRRGDRSTEITTLPGGPMLGQGMDEVEYFLKKLYKALGVPISRLDPDAMNSLGRATEISRDEVKFQKFIDRLRLRYQGLFTALLGKQLILKNICTLEEWKTWEYFIDYDFARDNFFAELKDLEVMQERLNVLQQIDAYEGKYFSRKNIKEKVLYQTESDIDEMQAEMDQDKKDFPEDYFNPEKSEPINNTSNSKSQDAQ